MITIVDYGTSNLGSMQNMLKKIGCQSRIASTPAELEDATKIIVPGVGSFDSGMRKLNSSGMVPVLHRKVRDEKVPTLGVCLGMQLMTRGSEEGNIEGLGWLNARTIRFDRQTNPALKVPHMGWNEVTPLRHEPILEGMPAPARFYFAHSYHIVCGDPTDILLQAHYGTPFAAAVAVDNLIAAQFHPEKSHRFGMCLLRNFVERY